MENICKNCTYFQQHYIRFGHRYQEISYGHCTYPRLKKREAGTPACKYFRAVKAAKQEAIV